jgi:hypothetical protein
VDITSGISGTLVMGGVVKALGKAEVLGSNPPDSILDIGLYINIR